MNDKVVIDQSAPVRAGEELDNSKLYTYLRSQLDNLADSDDFSVEQFPNGSSNLTYRVRWGANDWVLRRPPFGANIKSGHDMEREYRILSGLTPIYSKAPRPVVYCADAAVLGAPFYLMGRVEGVIIRNPPPPGLSITPAVMEQVSRSVIENLAAIHALDYTQTDLKNFARPGSYVERQISGWIDRYAHAKTDDIPSIERVATWLVDHKVRDSGSSLIHNDYKYDNLILAADDLPKIMAVLDWEMATIGDPLMDLGTSLGYWVEPNDPEELRTIQSGATIWPGNFDRAQLLQYYALASGRELEDPVFYYVYGLFKIAVIVQQIYARYKKGLTTNPRFARLNRYAQVLCDTAVLAIEKKRIDRLS